MRKLYSMLLLTFAVLTAAAQPISEQQAKARALRYLQGHVGNEAASRAVKPRQQLTAVNTGMPHLYAFNVEGGGFVIASGDERTLPVLGYADEGSIDFGHMPVNMRSWLASYSEAIGALGNLQLTEGEAPAARPAIAPMLKTTWDQVVVYNQQCPVYRGVAADYQDDRTLTGCVATAMAQVMNYHQWPQEPTAAIPAYTYEVSNLNVGTENFDAEALPSTTFDWANMCDHYLQRDIIGLKEPLPGLTEAQQQAVAKLMNYCGHAVRMDYSPTISLAFHTDISWAMTKYFGYDKGAYTADRYYYTIDAWESLIYNELANNRPVIYGGDSDEGGHEFVCDGYDGKGLFHFNWGWEGDGDGFYSLSVLNSFQSGVSGVESAGVGFNKHQQAVIGVQKPQEGSVSKYNPLLLYSNYYVGKYTGPYSELYGWNAYVRIIYHPMEKVKGAFQVSLDSLNSKGEYVPYCSEPAEANFDPHDYDTFYFSISKTDEGADRQTKLYVRTRMQKADGSYDDWQLQGQSNTYFLLTVKDHKVTIEAHPQVNLVLKDAKPLSEDAVFNGANYFTLTIENKSDDEYQGTLVLTPYFIGNDDPAKAYEVIQKDPLIYPKAKATVSSAAFIKAGATEDVTFCFKEIKEFGTYLFLISDELYPDDTFARYSYTVYDETGINAVGADIDNSVEPIYDLNGRRVQQPQPGRIYIKGGKKYVE